MDDMSIMLIGLLLLLIIALIGGTAWHRHHALSVPAPHLMSFCECGGDVDEDQIECSECGLTKEWAVAK